MLNIMVRGYVKNFLPYFLQNKIFTRGNDVINMGCLSLLVENEHQSYFIHNSLIRCKYTKFIIFSCKKSWKNDEKPLNKPVDILISNPEVYK